MTKTVFAAMETTQNPMGRSAKIRTKSADGRPRWWPLGRERPQGVAMAAELVLTPSVCANIIAENLTMMVAVRSIWEMSV